MSTEKKSIKNKISEHLFDENFFSNENEKLNLEKETSTNSSTITDDSDYDKGISFGIKKLKLYDRKFSAQLPSNHRTTFVPFPRTEREIRATYFTQLKSKGLFEKSNEKKFNNLFIFDWDDTLLCTSAISTNGYFDEDIIIPINKMKKIRKLEKYVKNILGKAIEKGETYIITNSEPGWVEYSCKRFFPETYKLLKNVKILSARGLYAQKFPDEIKRWKINTFGDIIKEYKGKVNLPTNIMCIGDSLIEMEAGRALASKFPTSYIKAIKFKQTPIIEDLIMQISLIIDKFDYIYSTCKNWTIKVDKKKK